MHLPKNRATRVLGAVLILLVLGGVTALMLGGGDFEVVSPRAVSRPPHISPDYRDILIPPNIAPLNFAIHEPGTRFQVRISVLELVVSMIRVSIFGGRFSATRRRLVTALYSTRQL